MTNYYLSYLKEIKKNLENIDYTLVEKLEKKILEIKKNKSKIIFFGNGGSAAISKHFAIDVLKNLKVRTLTFGHVQITCFSNDYGHKNWMKKSLEFNYDKKDLVIFTSSSGNSINHIRAAQYCKKKKIFSVSFTGFNNNKLSKITNCSFVVKSKNYNIIENVHSVWFLMIIDRLSRKLIF